MTTAPIALIFGAGANVGASVARAFAAKGYKIAVTSRQPHKDHDEGDYLRVQSDLEDPNSVEQVFDTVRKTLGHPSVVVYNGQYQTTLLVPCNLIDLILTHYSLETHRKSARRSNGSLCTRHA